MSQNACSAYLAGPNICKNGFPQNGACIGSKCRSCGIHTAAIPMCQREDIPARWVDEDGLPKHSVAKLSERK